jgi:ubiquinone/menaquinone biosynthesis C-methylase UbiE
MNHDDIQAYTNQLYNQVAETYEDEPGHGFKDTGEQQAWEADIRDILIPADGTCILDVGTGTGVLARLFVGWGCRVVGMDPAEQMLAEARRRTPDALPSTLNFVRGDAQQDGQLFPDQSFDYIVSRQVVCHFSDPLLAFGHWRRWLKPDGRVMVIDGLWTRAGWHDDQLVDSLPLSCLQTRGTLVYLLKVAGFTIEHCGWLARVNQELEGAITSPRYLVVARGIS